LIIRKAPGTHNELSWSPFLIDASADRHFNRDMAWYIDS
jgi:hypothetical protein